MTIPPLNLPLLKLAPAAIIALALLASLAPAHGPGVVIYFPAGGGNPPEFGVGAGGGNQTGTGGIGGGTLPGLGGPPAGGGLPRPGSTSPTNPNGATAPGLGGRTPGQSRLGAPRPLPRSRSKMTPRWHQHMKVSWVSAFPLTDQNDGYAATQKDVATSLKTDPSEGGWVRQPGPSIVLVYDPTSQKHQNAIENLDKNLRLVAATRLFNCFKVDGRALAKGNKELSLTVYDDDGKKVGDLQGRKLRKALKLMEQAYDKAGGRLTKVLPKVERNARGLATCEMDLEIMECQIVCPDCGEKRDDVLGNISKTTALREQYKSAIGSFWVR